MMKWHQMSHGRIGQWKEKEVKTDRRKTGGQEEEQHGGGAMSITNK